MYVLVLSILLQSCFLTIFDPLFDDPPIIKAVKSNDIERVRTIIRQNGDIDVKDWKIKRTALIHSADTGNVSIAKLLLDAGANIDEGDRYGNTALSYAAMISNRMISLLIENGANVDVENNAGATPLLMAIVLNRTSSARPLLEAGANPNIALYNGITPLMFATMHGGIGAIELLKEYRADPFLTAKSTSCFDISLLSFAAMCCIWLDGECVYDIAHLFASNYTAKQFVEAELDSTTCGKTGTAARQIDGFLAGGKSLDERSICHHYKGVIYPALDEYEKVYTW